MSSKIHNMKAIIFSIFLLLWVFSWQGNAQDTKVDEDTTPTILKTDNDVFEMGFLEVRIISPQTFGSHFLNQAYEADVAGFDMYLNIYKVYDFRFGLGLSRFGSSLTDASLAGNFNRVAYRSYYFQVAYAVYQSTSFEAGVAAGYGFNYFRQRTRNVRRGDYTAGEVRASVYGRYQFGENFGVSFGASYLTTNQDVNTASQAADLFGRTHVIYPYFGVYVNFQ